MKRNKSLLIWQRRERARQGSDDEKEPEALADETPQQDTTDHEVAGCG